MKVATWNVNSIRTRLPQVTNWLAETQVDALCLQETKVVDADFPQQAFVDLGYSAVFSGQKSYNGVAILSRRPLDHCSTGFTAFLGEGVADLDQQKRLIAGSLDGIRIINLYVPNGSAVGSEKYDYKLRWLATLARFLKASMAEYPDLLVCGDFNIALEDIDIHDATGRQQLVMATNAERQALQDVILPLQLADVFRKFTPDGGQFSWWDYRAAAFRRNLGWRIDHIYLTSALYERAIACTIDKAPRKLEKPSDHAPVVVEL